jgi:hypothetical protein
MRKCTVLGIEKAFDKLAFFILYDKFDIENP